MRSMIRTLAVLSLTSATTAFAQGSVSGAPRGDRPRGAPAAQMLLAHTGELGLTDAQVIRLAAIARRSETRRSTMRASMDSARQRFAPGQPGDSVARRQFRQRMQADMEKAMDAGRVDQRDAIAVLNADQQAKAWEMVANRGRAGRRQHRPGFRERRPMDGERQVRPRRNSDSETQ